MREAWERKQLLPALRDWLIVGGVYAAMAFVCVLSALSLGPLVSLIELIIASIVLATIIVVRQSRSE